MSAPDDPTSDERGGPVVVDEVTLNLSEVPPEPLRPLPPTVLLPEPMLRYACNQQGCCCSGWRIGFKGADLVKLGNRLKPADREKLTRDVEFRVRTDDVGDRVVEEFVLMDDDRLCRFLERETKGCGIHKEYGLETLPDLCVDFPVANFAVATGAAFYFDPVCPSVLTQLAESPEPLRTVVVETPYPDAAFELRARHSKGVVVLKVRGEEVSPTGLDRVRTAVLQSLADVATPVWSHLHAIETAFSRLAQGTQTAEEFAVAPAGEPGPFFRHLGSCLGAHGRNALTANFEGYRRFVFSMPIAGAAWEKLGDHLEQWGPAYETFLGPNEALLRPLQLRYLALCHVTPFAAPDGELPKFAGVVTHRFCTALRYAAAFGAVLERPVDVGMMQAALGAAEYFYRSRAIAPELMPWFEAAA